MEFDAEFKFAKIQNSHFVGGLGGEGGVFSTFDAESKFAKKKNFFAKNFLSFRAKMCLGMVFDFEYRVVRYTKYSEPQTISMDYQPLCASSPKNPSLRLKHSPCMPFKKPATSASCLSQSPLKFIIHSCRFIRLSAASTGRPFQLHLRLIHDPINAGLSKRLTSVKASLAGQNFVDYYAVVFILNNIMESIQESEYNKRTVIRSIFKSRDFNVKRQIEMVCWNLDRKWDQK